MRIFRLNRKEDVSGVSGTGVVAEGIEFSDGRVAMRWICGTPLSTCCWDSVDDMMEIVGHGGRTVIEWFGATVVQWLDDYYDEVADLCVEVKE